MRETARYHNVPQSLLFPGLNQQSKPPKYWFLDVIENSQREDMKPATMSLWLTTSIGTTTDCVTNEATAPPAKFVAADAAEGEGAFLSVYSLTLAFVFSNVVKYSCRIMRYVSELLYYSYIWGDFWAQDTCSFLNQFQLEDKPWPKIINLMVVCFVMLHMP